MIKLHSTLQKVSKCVKFITTSKILKWLKYMLFLVIFLMLKENMTMLCKILN
jgi:hypothetical protein